LPHLVRLSGGITLQPEITFLNLGSISYLRDIVISSRPTRGELTWQLPLAGWEMPNARDLAGGSKAQGAKVRPGAPPRNAGSDGFSLSCQSIVFNPGKPAAEGSGQRFTGFPAAFSPVTPLRGVSMRMEVTEKSFRPDPTGQLRKLRDQFRKSRPAGDALGWPAEKDKGP
jgi:hypothetical protein